jgi:hypothetical protein
MEQKVARQLATLFIKRWPESTPMPLATTEASPTFLAFLLSSFVELNAATSRKEEGLDSLAGAWGSGAVAVHACVPRRAACCCCRGDKVVLPLLRGADMLGRATSSLTFANTIIRVIIAKLSAVKDARIDPSLSKEEKLARAKENTIGVQFALWCVPCCARCRATVRGCDAVCV